MSQENTQELRTKLAKYIGTFGINDIAYGRGLITIYHDESCELPKKEIRELADPFTVVFSVGY